MTAARAIVECIKREKINYVFTVPGESFLPLLDAFYDEPSIQVISCRHEGGASFMAEGYAKASQKMGIVMATRGVGATNVSIGVHTAFHDSTPMVVFLGQVRRDFRGREGFQEINFEEFFKPITKWTAEIIDEKRIPEIVQRAFYMAKSGRPGPVVVSLPEDILSKEGNYQFGPVIAPPRPSPSTNDVHGLENFLNNAKKPVIIAGGGIKLSNAEDALISFCETFHIPVISAFRRHDCFPNNHPLYAGHLGLSLHPIVRQTIEEADLLLALGTRLSEVTTQDYSLIKDEHTLIHVDIDPSAFGKSHPPHLGIVADMKEALAAFFQIRVQSVWKKWSYERADIFQNRYRNRTEDKKKWSINKQVIDILQKQLPKHAIITNDAGNFAGWLHEYFQFTDSKTYIGPTSGAMGYGMPAAIGAKLAFPDKTIISLSGDGGFMMTFQELETAVRYQIPIIALVFNNRMYGTIRMHQEIHYPTRVIATDLGEIDFQKMAKSVGAIGFSVKTEIEFSQALKQAFQLQKPAVIDIMTDQNQISFTKTIADIRKEHF